MLQQKNYDPALMQGASVDINLDLGEILDPAGNEMLEFDQVASAVNYVRLANSATANDPVISTQGDDTNINLQLTPSGTGSIFLGSRASGTVVAGVVTINANRGKIETGASFLAGSTAFYTFNFVNNKITPTSLVLLSLADYTAATGEPFLGPTTIGTGSCVVSIGSALVATPTSGSVRIHFAIL